MSVVLLPIIIIVISDARVKVQNEFAQTWPPGAFETDSGAMRLPEIPMKHPPRTGLTGEQAITVGPDNRVSFADGRMPAVLATPWLIASPRARCSRCDCPMPRTARAQRGYVYRGRTFGPCAGRVQGPLSSHE